MPNFKVIIGKRKVLVSAPHVFAHKRPSLSGALKQNEEYLDRIIESVCTEYGYSGIYTTSESIEYDPNFTKEDNNEYKGKVREIIKSEKIEYFVDLHGLNDRYSYDFDLQYCLRFIKSKKLAQNILNEISKERELGNFTYQLRYIPYTSRQCLAEFVCRELKIPAIQIEIAKYIREDKTLRSAFIKAMSRIVV